MPQLESPLTFSSGQVLTAADLNAHVNGAVLKPGSISEQTSITPFDVQFNDYVNIYDTSGSVLRRAAIEDILKASLDAKFGAINGKSGQDLAVVPASGYSLAITGNTAVTGNISATGTSNLTGAVTAGSSLTVTGIATFNSTEALKLPVGTTLQRPASPVAGQIRYNSTVAATEVYNGTSWDPVPVGGSTLTLPGTVNITGAIQYNGTPVFGLYEIYEETIPLLSWVGTGGSNVWQSSTFTKPSDEIWVFETSIRTGGTGIQDIRVSFVSNIATPEIGFPMIQAGFKQCSFPVLAGTTLTADAINLWFGGNMSITSGWARENKLRIYKYKTA